MNPPLEHDIFHMRHAVRLAARMDGQCWPNPNVGCILVHKGQVIGRGVTAKNGRPHAETQALEQAKMLVGAEAVKGATAYVTLEPCAHTGNTPPCAQALIAAGIARVVIAHTDPDPRTAGKGIAMLQKAGIAVTQGVCEAEARQQLAGFFLRITQNRPLVTVKLATSTDEKITRTPGKSQWITGKQSRAYAHYLRAHVDAILVGSGTALADNPQLTCRLPGLAAHSPVRMVLDRRLQLPLNSQLVQTAQDVPLWVLCDAPRIGSEHAKQLQKAGAVLLPLMQGDVAEALTVLAAQGINSLLVEGGATVASAFLQARLVDRLCWLQSPEIVGEGGLPALTHSSLAEVIAKSGAFVPIENQPIGKDQLQWFQRRDLLAEPGIRD